jgi:hypothetical protein
MQGLAIGSLIAAYLGGKDAFDQAIADFQPPTPTRTNAILLVLRMPQLPQIAVERGF